MYNSSSLYLRLRFTVREIITLIIHRLHIYLFILYLDDSSIWKYSNVQFITDLKITFTFHYFNFMFIYCFKFFYRIL